MLIRASIGLIALALSALCLGTSPADDGAASFEKLMKEFGTPGPQHEQFKRLAGTWNTETTGYFPNPDKPSTSKGKAKFTVLMEGRYLRQDFRSVHDGEKFTGMGILGYDKAKKKYVGIWIDNHGTGIMHSEATYDAKTHTMTEHAVSSSPLGELKFKMITQYKSDDAFVFQMIELKPDGENKLMDITYMRAKQPKPKSGE